MTLRAKIWGEWWPEFPEGYEIREGWGRRWPGERWTPGMEWTREVRREDAVPLDTMQEEAGVAEDGSIELGSENGGVLQTPGLSGGSDSESEGDLGTPEVKDEENETAKGGCENEGRMAMSNTEAPTKRNPIIMAPIGSSSRRAGLGIVFGDFYED
ncbi:hypothetical protein BJ508DRAFT_361551 [Ascobolus immersus RN42]|uniref:Uncharacterized protein n=1 Tax=Ascobolus immersus RN42 TaxID=1160509 RepID=A0A3N4I782_ASCIM|nr:hypothetical protein BJ508DRAFT_361551 [Ascobolus immersus RN42]